MSAAGRITFVEALSSNGTRNPAMPVSYIRRVLGWNPRLVLARPSCSLLVAWLVWTGRRGVHLSSGFSPFLAGQGRWGAKHQAAQRRGGGRREAQVTPRTQLSSRTCRFPHRPGIVPSTSFLLLPLHPMATLFRQDGLPIGTFSAPLPSLAI